MEKSIHESLYPLEIKVEKDEVNEPAHVIDRTFEIKMEKSAVTEVHDNNLVLSTENKLFGWTKLSRENNSLADTKYHTDLQQQNVKLEWSESMIDLNRLHTEIKIEQDETDENYWTDLTENKIVCVNKKLVQCDICTKTFSTLSYLKIHKRIHRGLKPFECNICTKTFTTSGELKTHERYHSGLKPYECNICTKAFATSSVLKTHERIHSGEKPYSCNICTKTFIQSGNLKKHERIHSGEKPYECKICTKTFSQSDTLKTHERIHTGERPYKCSECSKAFTTLSSLRKHERLHIGKKP